MSIDSVKAEDAAAVAVAPAPVPSPSPKPADVSASATPAPSEVVSEVKPSETLKPEPAPKPSNITSSPEAEPAGTPPPPSAPSLSPSSAAKSPSSKSKKKKAQVTVTMATAATAQSSSQGAQGENTGRWTAEEHRLFLQGLEQHGKGWKKIASLIKSRTVVQIRTHAQKYFQKLAKARQNGEEGEVAMEGRGGTPPVPPVTSSAAQTSKRRRQTSGTKRKAIQSVVSSAVRQGKKIAAQQAAAGEPNPTPPLPAVAPALAPYVLPPAPAQPQHPTSMGTTGSCVPSITTAQGTISGPALEDSLFRFLTPAPVQSMEPQVNEVARQAGANPITLPSDQPSSAPSVFGGEISPTGVAEMALYPSWTDAKDTPSWYAKGSDVDALLDVADTLDWLSDTGDLHETYHPAISHLAEDHATTGHEDHEGQESDGKHGHHGLAQTSSVNNMSLNTLPRVDSAVDVVVPPLPSLFEGSVEADEQPPKKLTLDQLAESTSTASIEEHLQVFDTPLEEHDFVSTILENTGESSGSLPILS